MSVRICVQLMDKNSDDTLSVLSGSTVCLYAGASPTIPGDTPVGTFTENNSDGLYYLDVDDSGIYTVAVDNVIQVSMQGFFIHAGEVVPGTGVADTDIKYLTMTNRDGETCYVYPNANQNGIVVLGTQP